MQPHNDTQPEGTEQIRARYRIHKRAHTQRVELKETILLIIISFIGLLNEGQADNGGGEYSKLSTYFGCFYFLPFNSTEHRPKK